MFKPLSPWGSGPVWKTASCVEISTSVEHRTRLVLQAKPHSFQVSDALMDESFEDLIETIQEYVKYPAFNIQVEDS